MLHFIKENILKQVIYERYERFIVDNIKI